MCNVARDAVYMETQIIHGGILPKVAASCKQYFLPKVYISCMYDGTKIKKQTKMPLSVKQLKAETAARLKDLRRTAYHNLSHETIARQARDERNIKIGARTIRDLELESHDPRLGSLHILLLIYNTNLGDFFHFTQTSEEGRIVGEFLELYRRPENQKLFRTLFDTLLRRPE